MFHDLSFTANGNTYRDLVSNPNMASYDSGVKRNEKKKGCPDERKKKSLLYIGVTISLLAYFLHPLGSLVPVYSFPIVESSEDLRESTEMSICIWVVYLLLLCPLIIASCICLLIVGYDMQLISFTVYPQKKIKNSDVAQSTVVKDSSRTPKI